MWVQVVWSNLLCWVFLLCFSILSLSLLLSGLGSKPTFFGGWGGGGGSLNQGQGSTIWIRISFSDSLLSPCFAEMEWLNVAWGLHESGCWLKGLHQIPNESLLFHHCLHFHIYQTVSFVPGMSWPIYCYCKWGGDGIFVGREWLTEVRM